MNLGLFYLGATPRLLTWWGTGERLVGDQLNLERAMAPHVRFGGHFVQVRSIPHLFAVLFDTALGPCRYDSDYH